VTPTPPTNLMPIDMTSAGLYESPHSGSFAKIQILTIEELLSGKQRPQYPDFSMGGDELLVGQDGGTG